MPIIRGRDQGLARVERDLSYMHCRVTDMALQGMTAAEMEKMKEARRPAAGKRRRAAPLAHGQQDTTTSRDSSPSLPLGRAAVPENDDNGGGLSSRMASVSSTPVAKRSRKSPLADGELRFDLSAWTPTKPLSPPLTPCRSRPNLGIHVRDRSAVGSVQAVAEGRSASLPLIAIPGVRDVELWLQNVVTEGRESSVEMPRRDVGVVLQVSDIFHFSTASMPSDQYDRFARVATGAVLCNRGARDPDGDYPVTAHGPDAAQKSPPSRESSVSSRTWLGTSRTPLPTRSSPAPTGACSPPTPPSPSTTSSASPPRLHSSWPPTHLPPF